MIAISFGTPLQQTYQSPGQTATITKCKSLENKLLKLQYIGLYRVTYAIYFTNIGNLVEMPEALNSERSNCLSSEKWVQWCMKLFFFIINFKFCQRNFLWWQILVKTVPRDWLIQNITNGLWRCPGITSYTKGFTTLTGAGAPPQSAVLSPHPSTSRTRWNSILENSFKLFKT